MLRLISVKYHRTISHISSSGYRCVLALTIDPEQPLSYHPSTPTKPARVPIVAVILFPDPLSSRQISNMAWITHHSLLDTR